MFLDERPKATKIEDLFFPNGDPVVDVVDTFLKLKGDLIPFFQCTS